MVNQGPLCRNSCDVSAFFNQHFIQNNICTSHDDYSFIHILCLRYVYGKYCLSLRILFMADKAPRRGELALFNSGRPEPRQTRGKPASLSRLLAGRPKPCPALKRDCLAFANPSVRCGGRKPNSTRAGTRLRSIRRSKSYGWQARSYAGQVASATRIPYQEFGEKATISGSS